MNTLLPLRRVATRWLAAAGIALVGLGSATPASALTILGSPDTLEEIVPPGAEPSGPSKGRGLIFTKTGRQISCDAVAYRLRLEMNGSAELFATPFVIDRLASLGLDFEDQLPAGLRVATAAVNGDVTNAGGGGGLPVVVNSGPTRDTVSVSDFRISAADLDGLGGPDARIINFEIMATIDHAAFPAPAMVDNQGFLTYTDPSGATLSIPSHDPALPDDGTITTGTPTRIAIDLTGCDRPPPPPPPPGDDPVEACFRVETGEVDCTPGGAAFIYHMDVGPEMSGNVIQLRTSTPGVTVSPVSQVVPEGGGVLSWTITGAGPGDVVHLIAVGVETYSGPAEGVGICCTQTIDLVIPEDLDCPDRPGEPDIKVEKRADAARCTLGESCDFTITVSNAGDAPYTGKIVLEEVTTPVDTEVVSGPNAPWVCVPGATPMMCEHPEITLNPGASVELKLGLKTPAEARRLRHLRNCAEYDYTASGKEPFGDPTNDRACAVVSICVPGRDRDCTPQQEPRIDLAIRKIASPVECMAEGVCRFVITVANAGTTTYSGPLTVIDEFPIHPPASVSFAPTPPWMCVAESGIRFRCEHPPLVLVPGASVQLTVQAIVSDYPTNEVENCGEVLPVEGESNLTNNMSCATAILRRPTNDRPRLTVEKTGEAECRLGEECTFEITITNEGTGDFSGPMNIGDAIEIEGLGGASLPITAINPPLGCAPEPTELPFMCEATLTLGAGESRTHEVTVMMPGPDALPAGIPDNGLEGRNCFAIVEPGAVIERERMSAVQARPEGDGENGRYSCHPFRVAAPPEEVPQCSAGFVLNEDGRCVCPEGAVFRNGRCVEPAAAPIPMPRPATPPPPPASRPATPPQRPTPPPVRQPQQCLQGQVRTQSGQCVCPRGTTLRGGRCAQISTPPPQRPTPPPVRQPQQCLPGQVRTQSGECVCPRGTTLRGGRCTQMSAPPPQRPTPPPVRQPQQCLPGQVRTQSGQCVCPRGTTLLNNRCVQASAPPPLRQGLPSLSQPPQQRPQLRLPDFRALPPFRQQQNQQQQRGQ